MNIVTHDGIFHADDILAVAAAKILFPSAGIVRSRNNSVISEGDLVIDVGGVYDPTNGRFDHHQSGGVVIEGRQYAAFGLFWREYGLQAVLSLWSNQSLFPGLTSRQAERVAKMVDDSLVKAVDFHDLGGVRHLNLFPEEIKAVEMIPYFGISQAVSGFNTPAFLSTNPFWAGGDGFDDALSFASGVLNRVIVGEIYRVLGEAEVEEAMAGGETGVAVLNRFLPWQGVVTRFPGITHVVFPAIGGGWNAQQVNRDRSFPANWLGKNGPSLTEASGIPGGRFCHPSGFISGWESKEAAMMAASLS